MIRHAPILILAAVGLLLALCSGCDQCETNGDCLIMCDCDGDGAVEALYPHDCNLGTCGNDYDAHLEAGCEALCDDQYAL